MPLITPRFAAPGQALVSGSVGPIGTKVEAGQALSVGHFGDLAPSLCHVEAAPSGNTT